MGFSSKHLRCVLILASTVAIGLVTGCADPPPKPPTEAGLAKFRGHELSAADLSKMREAQATAMRGVNAPTTGSPSAAPTPGSYYKKK